MAGDVELNPGPGTSRSSLSPGQELELSDEGFVIINPQTQATPVVNLISPDPPGPSSRPYAHSAPTGHAEPLFQFHLDEVPAERFNLILAKHDKPDVTRIYEHHHDVEILS